MFKTATIIVLVASWLAGFAVVMADDAPAGSAVAPAATANSASAPPAASAASAPSPDRGLALYSAEPAHDFGKADSTRTVVAEFKLANRGARPIEIESLHTSCACLAATPSEKTIPPGGTVTVTARLPLWGFNGPVSESVMVAPHDRTAGLVRLQLKGTAVERLTITPNEAMFARVMVDEAATQTLRIAAKDPAAVFAVTKVESTLPFVATEAPPGGERVAAHDVVVRLKPPVPRGRFEGKIKVATDSKDYPLVEIAVAGKAVGELDVSPDVITLVDKGEPAARVTRVIQIAPGKVKTFAIKSVAPPLDSIKVEVRPIGGADEGGPSGAGGDGQSGADKGNPAGAGGAGTRGYMIVVRNIPVTADLDGKEMRITTDVPGMEEIRVPFKVTKAE